MILSIFHIKKTWLVLGIIITAIVVIAGCHFTQETLPSDAQSGCSVSPNGLTAAEFNTWFKSGSVSLNGAVNPANSVTFPSIPNCTFYKWSEQMFLWLTSPATGIYGNTGLVLTSPAFFDVSLPDVNGDRVFEPHTGGLSMMKLRTPQHGLFDLPVLREKRTNKLLNIIASPKGPSGNSVVLNDKGKRIEVSNFRINDQNRVILLDNTGKEIVSPRPIITQDSAQLKINPANNLEMKMRRFPEQAKNSLVAEIIVNKKHFFLDGSGSFHEVEQGQSQGEVLVAQNGSLVFYTLSVNNVYMLFRTMQGASPSGSLQFPTTQTQLNSVSAFAAAHNRSPIIDSFALAIEVKSSWVEAAGLSDSTSFIIMPATIPTYDKTNPSHWVPNGTKTVNLALVGIHVVGSTAQHPEMLWATFEHVSNAPAADYSYNSTGGLKNISQPTSGVWNFCSASPTAPFNVPVNELNGSDIVSIDGGSIGPSNVRREMPFGMPGNNASSNSEVIVMNNVVRSLLDPNDVRKNYIQTGTTWFIPGTTTQVGTNNLANTTMETFHQPSNCFSCHNSANVGVSHIFIDTKPLF